MTDWHMVLLPLPCIYSCAVSIMVPVLEKANPPRGGDAKLRASKDGGSRAAERSHK
jgi:hypothetical protein